MPARSQRLGALAACACAALALWLSNGALAVTDAARDAPRIGLLPSPWLLLPALICVIGLAWLARLNPSRLLPLFGSLVLLLPWLPLPLPDATLTWMGPVRFWYWGALAVVMTMCLDVRAPKVLEPAILDARRAPIVAGVLAFALYLAGFAAVGARLPGGDEPHYLVITQSLLRDRDLQIENNHQRGDYQEYFDGELRPDYLRRGQNGQIYSIHAPGLPALVAPAFALAGYNGVVILLAALAAWTAGMGWTLAFRLTHDVMAAWFASAAVCLTTPFFFHAFAVYPDPAAAALVIASLALLVDDAIDRTPDWRLAAHGAGVAVLPWLHSRYAVLAASLGILVLLRLARRPLWPRRMAAFVVVPAVAAAAWFAFFHAIYGTLNPAAPYGTYTQTGVEKIPRGLSGFLVDQQFGLLPNAPVLAIALAGAAALARRSRRLAMELAIVVLPYTMAAASYHMWWAGSSSPGRFVVAVVPALALPAAAFFGQASGAVRRLAIGVLLLSVGMTASLALVDQAGLLFQDRDGTSLWLEWLAPLVDLPRGFPSLFRGSVAEALRDAAIWIACLAGASWVSTAVDTRLGRGAGGLAALVALPLGAMAALTIVWRLWHAAPVTATSAQLAMLNAYPSALAGVTYAPFRLTAPGDLVRSLRIATSARRPAGGDPPLVILRDVPPGRYAVHVEQRPGTAVEAWLDAGRVTIDRWTMAEAGQWDHAVTLPVRIPGLFVRTAPASKPLVTGVWLQPVALAPAAYSLAGLTSMAALKHASGVVYWVDGPAYVEPGGIWVRPGGIAQFALASPDAASTPLVVGSGPVANECTFQTNVWRQTLSLAPGAPQRLDVPSSGSAFGTLLTVQSTTGFVPADVDPRSTDRRRLGCRLEFP